MSESLRLHGVQQGFLGGSDSKASACSVGDLGLIPGLGRSPGEGNGNSMPGFPVHHQLPELAQTDVH